MAKPSEFLAAQPVEFLAARPDLEFLAAQPSKSGPLKCQHGNFLDRTQPLMGCWSLMGEFVETCSWVSFINMHRSIPLHHPR